MVYASRDMFEVDEPVAPAVFGAEQEDEESAEPESAADEQDVDPSE